MVKKICKLCKREFLVHIYRKNTAHFCSSDCYNTFRKNLAYPLKVCPQCKKRFAIERKTRGCKYCSKQCSFNGRRKYEHKDKICPVCKKVFKFSSRNPYQVFCSLQCGVENRAYKVNEKFFDKIDSEARAYLLGLIFSDGSVSAKDHRITLSSNDQKLLKLCKNLLETKAPIHRYQKNFFLIINNKKLHASLNDLGVIARKSWKELSVPPITNTLMRHFIRGVYDGDGCFYLDKRGGGKWIYMYTSLTCGSYRFLGQIKNLLENQLNISFQKIIFDDRENGKGSYQLRLSRQTDVKHFTDYLYQNCNYYLERKYNFVNKFYVGQI